MLQEKLGEFGLCTDDLVGLTSDGASTMVACGKLMDIIHQLCLGRLYFRAQLRIQNRIRNI